MLKKCLVFKADVTDFLSLHGDMLILLIFKMGALKQVMFIFAFIEQNRDFNLLQLLAYHMRMIIRIPHIITFNVCNVDFLL